MIAADLLLGVVLSAAPEMPTAASVARTVERGRGAVLRIVGGGSGEAIVIGSHGEILTVSRAATADELTVEIGKERRKAHVQARDEETGVVLATLEEPGDLHPPAVGRASRLPSGSYVVVLAHDHGEVSPTVARLNGVPAHPGQFRIVPSARAGSGVFNTRGELIAIQLERGGRGARTMAIEDVRGRFGSGNPASP
jgi:hypothetical protein